MKISDVQIPQTVGYLVIADLHIAMTKKPMFFHRAMLKILFGFHWIDKD